MGEGEGEGEGVGEAGVRVRVMVRVRAPTHLEPTLRGGCRLRVWVRVRVRVRAPTSRPGTVSSHLLLTTTTYYLHLEPALRGDVVLVEVARAHAEPPG